MVLLKYQGIKWPSFFGDYDGLLMAQMEFFFTKNLLINW